MSGRRPLWRRLYEGWMEVAIRFGEVQTTLIVAFVYAFVVGPMASAARIARQDLLDKRSPREAGSAWRESDTVRRPDLQRARRLF